MGREEPRNEGVRSRMFKTLFVSVCLTNVNDIYFFMSVPLFLSFNPRQSTQMVQAPLMYTVTKLQPVVDGQ